MLTLEEYIAKRKKESKINEFSDIQKLENLRICTGFVLDYFTRYLDISDEELKSGLHQNKVNELRSKLNDFNEDVASWIVDLYDKYDLRIDMRIWNCMRNTENLFLYYTENDFRELSYKCYNDNAKKMPFLKNQGEMLFCLIKNLYEIKCACSHISTTIESMPFLKQCTIDWIETTLVKYNVNIIGFVEGYCMNFFDKTYVYTPAKNPYDSPIEKEYNFKGITKNLFDIDTLYKNVGYKPFIKGHKQELELLIIFFWLTSIMSADEKEYWEKYLSIVLPLIN